MVDHPSSFPVLNARVHAPWHSFKMSLPENETTVNLKSASLVVIMLLHEGLTHIHSQLKPRLLFGESFTLKWDSSIFSEIALGQNLII